MIINLLKNFYLLKGFCKDTFILRKNKKNITYLEKYYNNICNKLNFNVLHNNNRSNICQNEIWCQEIKNKVLKGYTIA